MLKTFLQIYFPRWLTIDAGGRKLKALAFTANRNGMTYTGKQDPQHVARILARAAGHVGSGASYLFQTVTKLEEFGIHDTALWHLQHLVAEEIRAMGKGRPQACMHIRASAFGRSRV